LKEERRRERKQSGNEGKPAISSYLYSHTQTDPVHINRTSLVPFTEAHAQVAFMAHFLYFFSILHPLVVIISFFLSACILFYRLASYFYLFISHAFSSSLGLLFRTLSSFMLNYIYFVSFILSH